MSGDALIARARAALQGIQRAIDPFVGFADVLNPGNGGHSSFGIYVTDDGERKYWDTEGAQDFTDDDVVIAAGAGWPKVSASYVTHLTMGDFRRIHAAADLVRDLIAEVERLRGGRDGG